jgi:hypothetical protein
MKSTEKLSRNKIEKIKLVKAKKKAGAPVFTNYLQEEYQKVIVYGRFEDSAGLLIW